MAEGSESEARGLNALGNPDVTVRGGEDRGPDGEGRIGNTKPGGILARGTASSVRSGRGGVARGTEQLRSSSR